MDHPDHQQPLTLPGGWPRYPKKYGLRYKQGDISTINPAIDGTLVNTATLNVQNQRYGLDFSNKFAFTPELSVTLAANMQFEHLDSNTSLENYKLFMLQSLPVKAAALNISNPSVWIGSRSPGCRSVPAADKPYTGVWMISPMSAPPAKTPTVNKTMKLPVIT
ncbi:hypothetical protein ABN09_02330 [Morganella morganii]|nr:hypothetical protein ABN09_02330 [Morganella morganii]